MSYNSLSVLILIVGGVECRGWGTERNKNNKYSKALIFEAGDKE